jgi:hypothetical protein
MATSVKTAGPQRPGQKVEVEIYMDPITKKIEANPETFYVSISKNEEVEFVCKQPHEHGRHKCFLVHFDEPQGSPFAEHTFKDHGARSGCAIVAHGDTEYKYTVWVPGVEPLDPRGVVLP